MVDKIVDILKRDANSKNVKFYYLPLLLIIIWTFCTFCTFFVSGLKNISNFFVILSIIIRIAVIGLNLYFTKKIYFSKNKSKEFFLTFKSYIGYGVVVSYLFFSLPRLTAEFIGNSTAFYSVINFIFSILCSLTPAIIYLIIKTADFRLLFEIYSEKDIEVEEKAKKNKQIKRDEHTKLRNSRSFLRNLWYEWVDVILQAIIIAMIIQQFIFQLYQIPSESMVPTFVKKDRVLVNKMIYGPQIPLTKWKIPSLFNPKIGDIVVFINPEIDDRSSEISYNSVFARVFHPFIYMLTLSLVDIDKKADGTPKERFIVKRLIAGEDEKICMVNDRVYKKNRNSKSWDLFKVNGLKNYGQNDFEYGRVDLYHDNKNMDFQVMTKALRDHITSVENTIDKISVDTLQKSIEEEKSLLLKNLSGSKKLIVADQIKFFLETNRSNAFELLEKISYDYMLLSSVNYRKVVNSEIQNIENTFNKSLENYINFTTYNLVREINFIALSNGLTIDYIKNNLISDIEIKNTDSPFTIFMKKTNSYYKLMIIRSINLLFSNSEKILNMQSDSENLSDNLLAFYKLSLYLNGIEGTVLKDLFNYRNFKDYPYSEDDYIERGNYFMMGDNRYNSADMRFKRNVRSKFYLDSNDSSLFSKSVISDWSGHTVKERHILGKAVLIYYPLERLNILK